ncbi:MAG: hypothetical protein JNK02_09445 [Planctomycetes bacterium]|nr:hypothetical protein [Planctomycetota bacterium]
MKTLVAAVCLAFLFPPPARALLSRPDAQPTAAQPAPVVPALQQVAVIGASISAGIGLDRSSNPFAGEKSKLQLAQIVDASILGAHDAPWNGADFNFFSSPEAIAKRSAADAKAEKPSALVALDYCFWLAYGPGSDEKREARLEVGLKSLEAFTCPVLVGDLPDFRGAGTNPLFLPKESIPPAETLARLNKRLYAWADARKNVIVVPQAEFLRKLIADEPITVGATTYEPGSKPRLLQADNLHTTLEGTCALWIAAVEAWRAHSPELPAAAFLIDAPALAVKAEELAQAAPTKKGKGKAPKSGKDPGKKQKIGAGS